MTNEVAKTDRPVILQYLEQYRDQIAAALPRHMTADRMARIVTTEIRRTPALLQCSPKSLFGAVIQASQLGLEPGSALGHCYLIPFKQDVTLIIGYRGMIDLARRSGQIISIEARAVRQGDEFAYTFGLSQTLEHTPISGPDAPLTHVYAVARLKDGGVQWDVMTLAEVEAIKAQSKAGRSGPWVTHFEEMAKKTVIRRLFKYLPVSIEIQQAVGLDEQADAGIDQQNASYIDGEWSPVDSSESDAKTKSESRVKEMTQKLKNSTAPGVTYAEIAEQMKSAQSVDDVATALDLARELPQEQSAELGRLANERMEELQQ